jgi:Holliday junction resolvasome RuvABC endonuclease subunit
VRDVTTLLALDLASKTGWAFGEVAERPLTPIEANAHAKCEIESGTVRFSGEGGAFFRSFATWLTTMLNRHQPNIVVFEAPVLPSRTQLKTIRRLYTLAGLTEMLAEPLVDQVFEAHLQAIKKHATGNGRADKAAMMRAAQAMGWRPVDDNEADALWLHSYASTVWRAGTKLREVA